MYRRIGLPLAEGDSPCPSAVLHKPVSDLHLSLQLWLDWSVSRSHQPTTDNISLYLSARELVAGLRHETVALVFLSHGCFVSPPQIYIWELQQFCIRVKRLPLNPTYVWHHLSLSLQKNWLRENFVPLKWDNNPCCMLRAPASGLHFWDRSFAKGLTRVSHSNQPTVGIISLSLSLSLLRRIRCRRKLYNTGYSHDTFPLGPQLGAHGWPGGSEVVVWPRVRVPGVFSVHVQCHHALQLDHLTRHRACELINFQPIGSMSPKIKIKLANWPADSARTHKRELQILGFWRSASGRKLGCINCEFRELSGLCQLDGRLRHVQHCHVLFFFSDQSAPIYEELFFAIYQQSAAELDSHYTRFSLRTMWTDLNASQGEAKQLLDK